MLAMSSPYLEPVLGWYAAYARDLPWRAPGVSPWAVLVSEIMLQQTPVSRVLPAYQAWLERWPRPAALAADSPGEAVRQWGRLGYPRRALRLHETATIVTRQHGGQIPSTRDELLALPGIGAYTAAAVAVFAFGQRHAVLDTNVRRVLTRLGSGREFPGPQPSTAEYRFAESLLPRTRRSPPAGRSRSWSLARSPARRRRLDAMTARSWRSAPGSPPGQRPRSGRSASATKAPTASAGAASSPCCAIHPIRCRRPTSTRSGPTTANAPALWTAW